MPARTYVPTLVTDLHELAVFLAKWNAIIRPAIATIDSEAVAVYDTLYGAVIAFDALRERLYPLGN